MDPAPGARVELLEGFTLDIGGCRGGVSDGLPRGAERLVALLGVSRQPTRLMRDLVDGLPARNRSRAPLLLDGVPGPPPSSVAPSC
jgi:hypothetical protein